MNHLPPPQGFILFAHGSRDPLWRLPIEAVAQQVRQSAPHAQVECAYLELTKPDVSTVVAQMLQNEVAHIRIVPMFLGVGKHAREDLPDLIEQLRVAHPLVTFELRTAIGEEPELTKAMADIALKP